MQPNTKKLQIQRHFTKPEDNRLKKIKYERRISQITNEQGKVMHEQKDVEVPTTWSQVATDILAQKYFRRRGVPNDELQKIDNQNDFDDFQSYLQKYGKTSDAIPENQKTGENSIKQTAHRLAGTWAYWGEKYDYFETKEDVKAFYEEAKYMIIDQIMAPNSPQWFNTGLNWAYGIAGEAQGHYYIDPETKQLTKSTDAYTHPQPHACFIQGVKDDLINEDGIFNLQLKEARVFKYGSGSGTNFSCLRGKGEKLSTGGVSAGLMSFLKIFDVAAGSIKSGGTTRRAAKMVCIDLDHPEIEDFINWKLKEERKVASLVAGSQSNYRHLKSIVEEYSTNRESENLKLLIKKASDDFVPLNYIKRVLMLIDNGMKVEEFTYEKYDTDFRSEAYETVSGQNSNNSIRVNDQFMQAVLNNGKWDLINRIDKKVAKTLDAKDLWDKIAVAAWECADPGIQFDTTINDWHTCPKDGKINASNPCSEYMFLDETACNIISINLDKFYNSEKKLFDIQGFKYAIRICTIILEISVLMAQLVSPKMAERTYQYRTLGLGYANLGTILMKAGIPYNSDKAFNIAGTITSILTGEAYATSAELASAVGTFERYSINKDDMMCVLRNHRAALVGSEFENMHTKPMNIQKDLVPNYMFEEAVKSWDKALELGEKYGYRNAQTTFIAPTGTTGLVMDCGTTGIEPDFALVKYKKLVGGGYFKFVNTSVEPALRNLGYDASQIAEILKHIDENSMIEGAPHLKESDMAVFDTASKNGANGTRFIEPIGHVKMLAYTQPFVSGSISKTINLPETATIQDVKDIYLQSWQLGLKCNALYRDGSKLSQPLTTGASNNDKYSKFFDFQTTLTDSISSNSVEKLDNNSESKIETKEKIIYVNEPKRRRMGNERDSVTHKFNVGGHEGYITVGLFEDGKPGEIFLQMNKEGSTLSGIMDAWAITLSLGLQYGVPLESLIRKFVHARFEPSGMTENKYIPIAKSIVDYIGRWLAIRFLPEDIAKQFHTDTLVEKYNSDRYEKLAQRNLFEQNSPNRFELNSSKTNEMQTKNIEVNHSKKDSKEFINNNLFPTNKEDVIKAMRVNNEDAPACPECGAVMIRNGACYKCPDCGATTGCS